VGLMGEESGMLPEGENMRRLIERTHGVAAKPFNKDGTMVQVGVLVFRKTTKGWRLTEASSASGRPNEGGR
jgi:hypothetical protein